jgi:hypothetical protein
VTAARAIRDCGRPVYSPVTWGLQLSAVVPYCAKMPAAPARAARLARDLAAGSGLFADYYLIEDGAPAPQVPTYRGEGRCFG